MASPASSAQVIDGSAAHRAAASCWEIKQDQPNAQDGRYWLITPQLQAPEQFHCDMTTDGGGWVLIGRGREDWVANYNGAGTTPEVSATVSGQGAFSPRQLDSRVIDGLNGGRRIDSMSDGVRLRRATNSAGTSFQEVRFTYRSRDRWSWAFGAGHPITSFNVGGTTGTNRSTRDFGASNGLGRVRTFADSSNNFVRGFMFGQSVTGSTSASSHLYSEVSGGAHATPFTQVFIRPRLRTSDLTYEQIPNGGTSEQTALKIAENGSLTQRWGVTGLGNGGSSENASEVQAFAQIGNTMYVGGNFTTVQQGANATGSDRVSQPYLAAFDAGTGDWISSFRPTLNSHVKSLAALPGGRLAVGGEFTNVNGSARSGLVVLDTATGATNAAWTTNVQNRVSGGSAVSVRALATDGTWLYVGGAFSHFVRGSQEAYALRAARISVSTGVADSNWNPQFNGTVTDLDIASGGQRVYFSGYFTTSRGATADRGAAMSTASGAAQIPWQPTHSTAGTARYQQAVEQLGSRVWLGGSQHNMFSYDTSSFALNGSSITRPGGDFQAMTENGSVVYAGCHCPDWNFDGTTQYDGLSIGSFNVTWRQADKIYDVGAWDNATGLYAPDFTPRFMSRSGRGAWALEVADDETLWAGGTFTSALRENGANQWVGGFARFAVRPHTAPPRPTAPSAELNGDVATVSWTRGSSGVTHEVIRNDRVVATTTGTSADVPDSEAGDRFFVRASDGRGNRSASTSVVEVAGGGGADETVLENGSTWTYLFDNTVTVDPAWRQPSFDDSAWESGAAALGWGTGPIATNIDVPAGQTRALTSYHRTSFDVATPADFDAFELTTRADDGIVVYVNGTEVGRSNMPSGTITPTTYATTARSTTTALANPVVMQVPINLIQPGDNTIAVEVHSNYRSTPNTSMDVTIEAQR